MGRGRGVSIVILAEDAVSERFARLVLTRLGYGLHDFRPPTAGRPPSGHGDAKQWVDRQYSVEVNAYCKVSSYRPNVGLLVATDADNQTVDKRLAALAGAPKGATLKRRADDEKIAHWIPRWSIETWGIALTGGNADEETRYKKTPQTRDIDWKRAASAFVADYHRPPPQRTASLPSLFAAYRETDRFR